MYCKIYVFFNVVFLVLKFNSAHVHLKANFRELSLAWDGFKFDAVFDSEVGSELLGNLGLGTSNLGNPTECTNPPQNSVCYEWAGGVQTLTITDNYPCYRVHWETRTNVLKDCFFLGDAQWYGSGERHSQRWPIQLEAQNETAFVTNDVIQFNDAYGGVSEPYWLNSDGFAVFGSYDIPLFVSLNQTNDEQLCLQTKYERPYPNPSEESTLHLKYSVCSASDVKSMHIFSINNLIGKPRSFPDERVFKDPIWSTWAQYKVFINETKVFEYANAIVENNFNNSQLEIDDNWEICYGSHEFDPEKFPDPAGMVATLKNQGFRVTLWIHPFINENCYSFEEARPYLVKDKNNNTAITSWWQGKRAGIVDFTNPEARDWWEERIRRIQSEYDIDSFKFDAGETNWLPENGTYPLTPDSVEPNVFSTAYIQAVARFGGMAEVRTGWKNQAEPIFFRMLDKYSTWDYNLGLKTLIPSLLQFSITGYPFVLPDMIGGNGYLIQPDKQLFIRWLQANTFMPTIQYSYVPWNYDNETIGICRHFTALHNQYGEYIVSLAQEASTSGIPINRPIWWIDPLDTEAQKIEDGKTSCFLKKFSFQM
ncbi:hypothetical protein QYM36_001421 [Artemia franciscana]|uniref:Glycoside hydrolase family 31 TIM barrel domain-containing protein n=1 Tax=Artemia franciscana TaxID=6661 RepID=A0AA88LC44_ARTSF|nr:hypothetical protein QYM36_001421 [Artemia franciscana]